MINVLFTKPKIENKKTKQTNLFHICEWVQKTDNKWNDINMNTFTAINIFQSANDEK